MISPSRKMVTTEPPMITKYHKSRSFKLNISVQSNRLFISRLLLSYKLVVDRNLLGNMCVNTVSLRPDFFRF
jgi:hypothetical protein